MKLARGWEPAIPEVLAPRFRSYLGREGKRARRRSIGCRPSVLAEGQPVAEAHRPSDRIAGFCDTPLPWPRGQSVERRSDMMRNDEFENLPSFRAVR